ncbi:TPA: hypothetical protein QB650_000236 [Pasteurella multocida]|uniref:hypothetical protein n=1 Tax=Pasteurella multocida TaxID=747 RepID=UPI002CC6CEA1|nr:hypothetical protein [Pasteurella multocida]MEB3467301.1 hypothetical protein [Pasteurella multocida]MEB3498124.1 hypothetical protein [Pasteurella multocida]HDR1813820.1 hypothetical protein [Pasteurella multocida]HDR1906461.1 hypothetical protein [Pasteurella multocida]
MSLLTDFFTLIEELESCNQSTLVGICVIKDQTDLTLCKRLLDEDYEIKFDGELQEGTLHFTYSPSTAEGYASYEDFFDNATWITTKPKLDMILWHQWAKQQDRKINYIDENNILSIVHLAVKLKEIFYSHNNIVVFFSRNSSELSLTPQKIDVFIQLLKDFTKEQRDAIDELCHWLGNKSDSEHFHSKKSAFSTALTDLLIEKEGGVPHDICDLLEDIVNIKTQAIAQHDLYLADFSYGKFVKKIEENVSKFTTRINDALGKSVTQVLGIPIATAVFNLAKIDLHWGSAISLMIYTLLCALVLFIQQHNLSHIKREFQFFEEKLPKQLKNDVWETNKKTILSQLKDQKRLTQFLWLIILCAFFYASFLIGYLIGKTN